MRNSNLSYRLNMAKVITEKTIKEHAECVCGKGYFDQFQETTKHVELIEAGYTRKKFKDSGDPFYFMRFQTICDQCQDKIFNEPVLD